MSLLVLSEVRAPLAADEAPASAASGARDAGGVLPPLPGPRRTDLLRRSLAILRDALGSDDSEVRALAAEQWGEIGTKAISRALRTALRDPNGYVRIAAASSLLQLGDRSGLPVLVSMIGARPPKRSAAKAKAGGPEKPPRPPDPVAELRNLARSKVRIAAIRALAQTASTDSVKVLLAAKEDSDGFVRDAAAAGLARLGSPGEMDRFLEALDSPDAGERLSAVKRLADIATPDTLAPLRRMARDQEASVRAAAMEGLGRIGDSDALGELTAGIRDEDDMVRSAAVEALGRLRTPMAAPLLREAYEKSTAVYIRLLAVDGLVRARAEVDLGAVQRSLTQRDADTRLLAVRVLEDSGGSQAVDLLEYVLDDSSAKVRARAAAALIKLLK